MGPDYTQFHDFNLENVSALVFAGFVYLRNPKWFYLTNILRILAIYCVLLYLTSMAVLTMTFLLEEKEKQVMVFQTLCLLVDAMGLPIVRRATNESLEEVRCSLLKGVHRYRGEDEEETSIKRSRVKLIRFLVVWFGRLLIVTVIANIFFLPVLQYLTITEDTSQKILNPYLPLPIYMPFDTRTVLGYCVAFFMNGLLWVFLSSTSMSVVQIYLSTSFQLIAQIEILIHSLNRIEERAQRLMTERYDLENGSEERVQEYQRCLYLCLRENIIHHQAILRLKQNISPFIELLNGFIMFIFVLILASTCLLIIKNPSINIALGVTVVSDVYIYYVFCSLGQMVTDTNGEIRNSLYSIPWYNYNQEFKALVKTMLLYAQKPMIFRSTGVNISITLETYADMVSAAYKIMNVL